MSLLPQAPRCRIPVPSAHLEAEEGNNHFSNRGFLCPLAPGWQDLEQFPKGAGGCERTKRGCEKFLLCLMDQAANFSHPRQVLVFFLTAGRRRFLPRRSTIRSKYRQPADILRPRLERTNLGIVRHSESPPQRVQCEYSLGHKPKACPRDFSGARTKNQLQFLYTTIYCVCQCEFSFILYFLRERDETLIWWKTE